MHVNDTKKIVMVQSIDSTCMFQEQNFTLIIMHDVINIERSTFIITFKDVRDYAYM